MVRDLAVGVCVLTGILLASPSYAQTRFETRVAASDTVAVGRVVAAVAEPVGPAGQPGIHTRVTVQVDDDQVDFWVHGGRLGNQRRVVSGQPQFVVGDSVVVLLFRTRAGNLWPMLDGTIWLRDTVRVPDRSGVRTVALETFWTELERALQLRSER